jgi:hypothetical protein
MTITSLGALSTLSKLKIKKSFIVLWDRVVFKISTPNVCTQTSAMENHTMYIKNNCGKHKLPQPQILSSLKHINVLKENH